MGGNQCSSIKVNKPETVCTHRGPGLDFIWSGPATHLLSRGNTPEGRFHMARVGAGRDTGLGVRPAWLSPPGDELHHGDRPLQTPPGCVGTPRAFQQGKCGPIDVPMSEYQRQSCTPVLKCVQDLG